MTFDGILLFVKKLFDVLLVWLVIYYALKSLRKNVKMVLLFKGILVVFLLKIVSDLLDLMTVGYLLDYVIMWGRSQLLGRHKILTVDEREKVVYEIVQAVEYMKRSRIGALIVIERDVSLNEYIEKSKKLYADISSELLISIFFPNNPLHDGGVIIQGDKITSAGAVFPTSDDLRISKRLGTRHRAALGISEVADCIVLIVSEETGRISIAVNGELNYNLTLDEFKLMLLDELKPKKVIEEEEEEIIDENI